MGFTYFAADGTYGDAEGIVILDTSGWADVQWDAVDVASDSVRAHVARRMSGGE